MSRSCASQGESWGASIYHGTTPANGCNDAGRLFVSCCRAAKQGAQNVSESCSCVQPEFQEEYRRLSRKRHQRAVSAILSAEQEAVALLTRPAGGRLRTCCPSSGLDQRLTRLEQIAKQRETGDMGMGRKARLGQLGAKIKGPERPEPFDWDE